MSCCIYFALHPPPQLEDHMCAPNLSASVGMYLKASPPSATPHHGLRKLLSFKLLSFALLNVQIVFFLRCTALLRIVRHPPHRHPPHQTSTIPDIHHTMGKIGHPPHQGSLLIPKIEFFIKADIQN